MTLDVYLVIIGLVIGSFVNVVIYRIPRGRSFVVGRSECPNCHRKIIWYDLIPIISFLALAGRCRNCKFKIPVAYPLVELYSGIILLVTYKLFSTGGTAYWLFAFFMLELFLILGLIDLKHLILPDSLLLVLLAGVVLSVIAGRIGYSGKSWPVLELTNLVGAVAFFSAFLSIWFLSRGRWLGFGDVKLVGIIGLIFGFWGGLVVLYIAVVIGALLGAFLLLTRRASLKTKLPLGTLICFSGSFYILCADVVLSRLSPIFYNTPFILK